MRNIIFFIAIVSSFSCKNSETIVKETNGNYWTAVQKENIPEKYFKYQVFTLDEKMFYESLKDLKISLPNDEGKFNTYIIEESHTMSAELAAKFPNIKSYKGSKNYGLCSPRIETKKSNKKLSLNIAVFCNDKTYFIDKDLDLNIYILYNKKNAPEGLGRVVE